MFDNCPLKDLMTKKAALCSRQVMRSSDSDSVKESEILSN